MLAATLAAPSTMRNPRIYLPQPLSVESELQLNDEAANHVARVLRMKSGDPLVLFNGEGNSYQARVVNVDKRRVRVTIENLLASTADGNLKIMLGQTLSRGDRMDWAIQKATEMGVTDIQPLFSERCEVKLNAERASKRVAHWQQVAISACEQCGRNRVPRIGSPQAIENWIDDQDSDLKLVLHHRTDQALDSHRKPDSVSLLIGPEGGLTQPEIERAQAAGFQATALGPRVLRTETAPIAALSLIQYLWGDI
ncbi:16S rRNA (uracil(1498)-N(3))-methyltransferase [Aestuariirhabdus sp. Z084]|uniref:16S rRNA (uracil(1498)-N(3))-methyltransferase n=1 Tax=Aestuariirhabdus haliotis TaxID=2918751 RepID=UPI00201B3A1D|nr:16S rRNA (uracil(1498)-N(3))-methyltransferase [Aestuariirhabdus haliotis]MCL6414130.1 16S rRNA (uracil(1498)-N(3))-methyltransferase [Aestuariirhabdus haliotis]MCL6418062.1 16S rRNA (uracil(1498)-N(3))-methyltransferase [Aestuariirhabdus haliotis]